MGAPADLCCVRIHPSIHPLHFSSNLEISLDNRDLCQTRAEKLSHHRSVQSHSIHRIHHAQNGKSWEWQESWQEEWGESKAHLAEEMCSRRISPLLPFRIHIDIYRKNCRGQFLRKSLAVGNTLRQTLNPPRPLLSCSNDTQKVPCRFTFFFAFPCVVLIREDTSNHQIRYFKYATKIEPIVQGTSI